MFQAVSNFTPVNQVVFRYNQRSPILVFSEPGKGHPKALPSLLLETTSMVSEVMEASGDSDSEMDGDQARFLGHTNPEGMFLEVTSPK